MKQIVNQIMYLIVKLILSRILHLNKYLKVTLIVYHRVFRILQINDIITHPKSC